LDFSDRSLDDGERLLYVERDFTKGGPMKRLIAVLAVGAGLTIPAAAAAAPGPYTQPGYEDAISNTDCADHGSFGFFGDKGNPAFHDFGTNYPGSNNKPGANGQATGDANSNLCGNPQND
jgi:hypothetical protein